MRLKSFQVEDSQMIALKFASLGPELQDFLDQRLLISPVVLQKKRTLEMGSFDI